MRNFSRCKFSMILKRLRRPMCGSAMHFRQVVRKLPGYARPLRTWPVATKARSFLTRLPQRRIPPAPHAHHVEAFATEDNLFDRLLSALQILAHVHPANFAV